MRCWGANLHGQLGDGTAGSLWWTNDRNAPITVLADR
jgi:hypothetical protein